ncbi:MAG: Rieske 2Fe-2S domain-containing protein [candidate division Zixibacteria bacterium]|jgi:Rieske Fe-S protein|nr:Rieske 2Fe-2S domain-containing protein [candidate division Zixibacteria bacterium]
MADSDNKLGRRPFLELALTVFGGLAAGTIAYPIIRFLIPPKGKGPGNSTIDVAADEGMAPNSGIIFPIGNRPGILIRTPDGELRAFTAICTHLDCTVQYRSDFEHIWCACHNGHYDLRGRNIAGPPPRPLKEYEVNVLNGRIFVTVTA